MAGPQTPRLRALLAVPVTLALAGCADAPTATLETRTLRIVADEYSLTPQEVSVPAGRLTLVLRNRGRLHHNVHVRVPREEPGEQAQDLGGTDTAPRGETVRETLDLRPGTYELVCTNHNHDDLGERGTLTVRPR